MKTILTSSCFTLLTLPARCSFLKQTLHNILFPELKFCKASDRWRELILTSHLTTDVFLWLRSPQSPMGEDEEYSDERRRHCRRGSGAWPGQKVCRSLLVISSLSLSLATVTKPRMWSHGKRFVGTSGFLKISFPLHHEKVHRSTEAIITNLFQRFYCQCGNNAVFSWVSGH